MKAIRWKLLTFVSAVSLLLCLATVVLWVRSYSVTDQIVTSRFVNEREWTFWRQGGLCDGRGKIGVMSIVQAGPPDFKARIEDFYRRYNQDPIRPIAHKSFSPPETFPYGRLAGIGRWGFNLWRLENGRAGARPMSSGLVLVVPMWLVVLVWSVVPTVWMFKLRQRRIQRLRTLCRQCAYNLTGNTSGVCPECGTPVAGKSA